jgi:coenzyme F420-reducing hydrogenase alpha subunit
MSSFSGADILTRVEGHASVKLIRDGEHVVDASLIIHESPRLLEALLVGRRFDEIADIACRICSICSTVHKVAALQAVEQALGVTVSRQTSLLRELALHGGQIESHALHIFCLALPDYLGLNGINEVAAQEPEKLKTGLQIKRLGNLVQETVGGRAIHPFNLLIGGLGRIPAPDKLRDLGEQLAGLHNALAESISIIFALNDLLPELATADFCAVNGNTTLLGDQLVTSTGASISSSCAVAWLNERVETDSHAKVSHFDNSSLFMVGPLARCMLATPEAYAEHFKGASIRTSLKARAVELQQAVERAENLIKLLLDDGLHKEHPVTVIPTEGNGTSLIEAPRGTLLHSYRLDSRGICMAANIITPTAINQRAMAASLKCLTTAMAGADYNQVKQAAETLIRCYDPCISCAVH